MSGNAALAAARRRRNPFEQEQQAQAQAQAQSQKLQKPRSYYDSNLNIISENELISQGLKVNKTANIKDMNQLIVEHDKTLFVLERKLENLEQNTAADNSSILENVIQTMNTEIKLLQSSIAKQQKITQELTATVTSFRGTIHNQNNAIQELAEQLTQLLDTTSNSIVQLNISDKQND